jgi:hypothetical protein
MVPITLFPNQCLESVVSSYAIAVIRYAMLHRKRSRPPIMERPRHKAQNIQRRRSEAARLMRPAGMGLHGLLSRSSARLRYWLEKLNAMRCSHVHAKAIAKPRTDDAGALTDAKTTYMGISHHSLLAATTHVRTTGITTVL